MYSKNIVAAGALLSVAAAVPMVKRDVVWVTETDEAIVTVPVTTTVWVNPGETVPTSSATLSHYGHHRSHITTTVQSTVTVSALSSSKTSSSSSSSSEAPSSYEAPSTTSTSIYVASTPSSTSIYSAPSTSSSVYVAPSPTSTTAAPTTSTTSAAPVATSSYSSSGSALTGDAAPGTSYTGDFTWYDTGLGACGWTSSPSDKIVAIAESLFDLYTPASGNPNMNPLCGKTLTLTGADGSPYQATIVDRCGGCKEADLDLSQDFFNAVTNNGDGRVHNMSWKFD